MTESETPRMTTPVKMILRALLKAEGEMYGQQVIQATKLKSGTVYPALGRLAHRGWLTERWDVGPGRQKRYFALTEIGRRRAEEAGNIG